MRRRLSPFHTGLVGASSLRCVSLRCFRRYNSGPCVDFALPLAELDAEWEYEQEQQQDQNAKASERPFHTGFRRRCNACPCVTSEEEYEQEQEQD